ncbi:nuclear transport factor 2 family protein [Cytophagaceae bacterium YF14B1]|uniref:Nuclear transport factor 2 family protein n=1 Tax=Xanthocytophaga flava TaxID=3048013 RepID=A0AAE3QQ82_9BACT|nr:nuclear transport factor 2 family protein [Xanthocytophaga flavus]MDJ1482886.1 nuclear transport factor 2 family protein [Xanthocytophaga flavus]
MTTAEIERLVEYHFKIWNQRDPIQRSAWMQEVYATDMELVEPHNIAIGHARINEFVQNLQQKNPGFQFSDISSIDTHHNIARLYWHFGPEEKPDAKSGMDLFVMEDGKVQKLYVFVDDSK